MKRNGGAETKIELLESSLRLLHITELLLAFFLWLEGSTQLLTSEVTRSHHTTPAGRRAESRDGEVDPTVLFGLPDPVPAPRATSGLFSYVGQGIHCLLTWFQLVCAALQWEETWPITTARVSRQEPDPSHI